MKIIWKDNFNRETVSERLVCTGIQHKSEGELMLAGLRESCSGDGPDWYELVQDDYELYRFEP